MCKPVIINMAELEACEKGGYDCGFVETPHHQLQTKCPVCLCILRDPHVVDCCGHSFCYTCIKPIQDNKNLCPLCNGLFTVYPDKRLFRTLKTMKVCCAHVKSGCDWQGELGEIEGHLNTAGPTDGKLTGCTYVKVCCNYCGIKMERGSLSHHQLDACPKRPFSCDYCHEYAGTCEDVTLRHWLICPLRPTPCPNDCGIYPERRNLQKHLCNECEMAVVKCQFSCFGCKAMVVRKDLQDHLVNNIVTHLSLQSKHVVQLERKLGDCEDKIANLERENTSLRLIVQTLQVIEGKANIKSAITNSPTPHLQPTNNVPSDFSDSSTLNSAGNIVELEKLRSLLCIAPLQFTIHAVSKLQKTKAKWLSEPFYTHAQGYKMCLKVYPGGHSSSTGSDVSLYLCIMKGRYDDLLKWPFRGSVPLQLVDQIQDTEPVKHTISFHDQVCEEFSGRVVDGDMSGGWGILKFIPLDRLVPKYLVNDSLQIKVDKILLS